MNDFAASYSRVEEIVKAGQSIKENLTCRVCLELFTEPVSIKCGHKFCRTCILQVANTENAACPFCSIKIQKRSIPKEGNSVLESCVNKFKALVKAIRDDSGIDVTEPYNKVKHTKESVVNDKLDNSRFDAASIASFGGRSLANQSIRSKIFPSTSRNKKLPQRKRKPLNSSILKGPSPSINTLEKYLSNRANNESNHAVQPNEKVTSWLQNVTPLESDAIAEFDYDESSPSSNKRGEDLCEKSPFTLLKDSCKISLPKTYPGANKNKSSISQSAQLEDDQIDELQYKEVSLRLQEAETMAKRKKMYNTLSENLVKTSPSVPATLHSDAGDWRRVKKVGKEMQVKTFKSLHVSIEKLSSAGIADESEPCHSSANNEGKSASKDFDTKNTDDIDVSRINQSNRRIHSFESKSSSQGVAQDHKYPTSDSEMIHEEHILADNSNKILGKDKIVVDLKNDSNILLKNKNTSRSANLENKGFDGINEVDNYNEDEYFDAKSSITNIERKSHSPSKRKLSLKLKNLGNSKASSSSSTLVKAAGNSPLIPTSPHRPKSRLSHQLPDKSGEIIAENIKNKQPSMKSPVQSSVILPVKPTIDSCVEISNITYVPRRNVIRSISKLSESNINRFITFRKLGRICRKRKSIPFLLLGSLKPKEKLITTSNPSNCAPSIKIKSHVAVSVGCCINSRMNNVPINTSGKIHFQNPDQNLQKVPRQGEVMIISPEKDSQLKLLNLKSPDQQSKVNKNIKQNLAKVAEPIEPSKLMESDKSPNKVGISRRRLAMDEETTDISMIPNSQESVDINKSPISKSPSNTGDNVKKKINDRSKGNVSGESLKVDRTKKNQVDSMDVSDKESLNSSKRGRQLRSAMKKNLAKVVDDALSISSDEGVTRLSNTRPRSSSRLAKRAAKNFIKQIANESHKITTNPVESDSDALEPRDCDKDETISASATSTPKKNSSLVKKRTHRESSNDDYDTVDICEKWTTDNNPLVKRAKKIHHVAQVHSASHVEDNEDDIYVDVEHYEPMGLAEPMLPEGDPLFDDVINQVKDSKRKADNNKLQAMPSSINSADMFDTNDQSIIQPTEQINRRRQRVNVDVDVSSNETSPGKYRSGKENDDELPETTVVDKAEYDAKKRTDDLHLNKKIDDESAKNVDSQNLARDSLMDVTQEQIALKRFEKDLLGVDMSAVQTPKEFITPEKLATPTKMKQFSQQDEFDTDNIDATPVARKRLLNFPISTRGPESNLSSPEVNQNVIPAVTPMKNTKSYPLCHSTPMVMHDPLKNKIVPVKNLIVVCSSITPDNLKTVHKFVNKFKGKFLSNFTMDVTHVIVHTDPETKGGQKTSKYIQGIAFKKHVVNMHWVNACLEENKLVDEDDEKYDVLDPDTHENGVKRSRERAPDLFKNFAFYIEEPFKSMPLNDFKNVLTNNGAVIADSTTNLLLLKDKYRIVIVESEDLNSWQITLLKNSSGGALVSFEWIIDSISQYCLLSINPYLYETSMDEALAAGIPKEHLFYEEDVTEEDET